ncbi:LacI family transcriptional regulator [Pseudoxanthomonas japonensis]|uniref:XylR family transcriptional regulator n=1 Tax=Pseudoxanthomonas japonensis TaxID=69284 RepID=UPI001A4DF574|nr:DNA-binding transcriptional regulator [Pseudoxanthomonas japonensis]MBA3928798.1 XylR family transcriptional regulator [Xanthomonas sp.]MBL8255882.1 DNA-binding transcriptional regulator [Pseudoxanthomonas mexicana]MDR7069958.1 LacI family transcriptional regulator [Pseudoxanthomonas japonensis]
MSPHRIALLFNANKVYDRQIMTGIGNYLKSTRVVWDLFMEEDFRSRTIDIRQWLGDGIIADFDDPSVEEALSGLPIPVVAVGGSYADESRYPARIPYIATDNGELVRLAYDHLIKQGLCHFAFYGLPPLAGNRWAQEREQAYEQATGADGIASITYRGSPTSAGGWGRAQEDLIAWMHSLPKPIGIIAVTDARARQLLQACIAADIPVPEQVAIVGIDNDQMVQLLSRIPLTSVIQGAEEMGHRAAQTLHQMLRGGDLSCTRIVVPPVGLSVHASSRHQPLKSPHVMRACHYIRQYVHLGIKSEQVAQYVGISRTVLEEHFKRELNKSVHDMILEHKLEMARGMLEDASIPLADVAVRSGFTSLQYMYAVFRREYNCTPRELAKMPRGPA